MSETNKILIFRSMKYLRIKKRIEKCFEISFLEHVRIECNCYEDINKEKYLNV